MSIEIKVPEVGESVASVQIVEWRKEVGDRVEEDEVIVVLESEKATVDLPSPATGTLAEIVKKDGEDAEVGDVIARIDESGGPPARDAGRKPEKEQAEGTPAPARRSESTQQRALAPESAGREEPAPAPEPSEREEEADEKVAGRKKERAAARATDDDGSAVEDRLPDTRSARTEPEREVEAHERPPARPDRDGSERVPMSPLRKRIARRLVRATRDAALVTTFNDVDLSGVQDVRKEWGERFAEEHDVRLGLMSFFVRAAVDALQRFPELNSEVDGDDIVYHHRYDVGIAVDTGKGLVVPVLENAERMTIPEIERAIADFARRAASGDLRPEDLRGGTFTISNGGIFGSLLSTPIVDPPQSGILGLHRMEDRPVAVDGRVVVRPMMYVALTYDHRVTDGRRAVGFLGRIKETVEDPRRLLLDI